MNDFELPEAASKKPATKPSLDTQGKTEVNTENAAQKKPEYDKNELLKIFDELIFSGEYIEDVMVNSKLKLTFRTRTAEEVNEIQKAIDTAGLNLISSVESMRSIMNLQYAVIRYGAKDLSTLKYEEKVKFIDKLPGPVVGILIQEMSKFDQKVAAACREGEANF